MDNKDRYKGHVVEQLSAYMDGALDEASSSEVRSHIEGCAACHAEYRELRATRHLLRVVPTVAPPRAFTLTPEMVGRKVWLWQRLLVPRNVPRLATGSGLAFALVALLLVGNAGYFASSSNPASNAAISSDAEQKLVMPVSTMGLRSAHTPAEGDGIQAAVETPMVRPGTGGGEAAATSVMQGGLLPTSVADLPRVETTSDVPSATSPAGGGVSAKQGTIEPPLSASPSVNQYNAQISAATATATSLDAYAPQQSADSGRVLLYSVMGLLVTIGGAFAVGAVVAARR